MKATEFLAAYDRYCDRYAIYKSEGSWDQSEPDEEYRMVKDMPKELLQKEVTTWDIDIDGGLHVLVK